MNLAKNLSSVNRLSIITFFIGIACLSFSAIRFYYGIQINDNRIVISWLIGLTFWLSIAIGILFIIMLWYIFGAGWPIIIRRQLEHALTIFPCLALLFIPLILVGWFNAKNPGCIWNWIDQKTILPGGEILKNNVIYNMKSAYLNNKAFTIRIISYFTIFCSFSFIFRYCSFKMDNDNNVKWHYIARKSAAIGIIICSLVTTFVAFDILMSLSYQWFSTIYGVCFFATSIRAGLAVTLIICFFLSRKNDIFRNIYQKNHQYNLACLFLSFTVFWAYVTFSQYFLIYNANIPEETIWFNIRELNPELNSNSGWLYVSIFGLIFGYFLFPFIYLLFYKNKITSIRLIFICFWVLAFHLLDMYFNILPIQIYNNNSAGYTVNKFNIIIEDFSMIIGLSSLFIWLFIRSAKNQKIIPINDPYIKESLKHHE